MPLVRDKLLAILAFLAICALPRQTNPVRQMSASLVYSRLMHEEDTLLEVFRVEQLDSQSCFFVLGFATSLIEQVPNAKLSQQKQ